MVDPQQRRRGIGRSLLEAALPLCNARGCERLLLVVPRVSSPGASWRRASARPTTIPSTP